jgi:hypothetical protein
MKSCIEQSHVLHQILATNSCLLAALYQILGDDFLADFLRKLILTLRANIDFKGEAVGDMEASNNYRLKNTLAVLSFLYSFDILHDEFIQEVVVYLADNFSEDNVAQIQSIIQHAGYKVRQASPGSIKVKRYFLNFNDKLIVDYTKRKYEEFKLAKGDTTNLSKKMEFMLLNLSDIKHNKKLANDAQDRLNFLTNWLKKALAGK